MPGSLAGCGLGWQWFWSAVVLPAVDLADNFAWQLGLVGCGRVVCLAAWLGRLWFWSAVVLPAVDLADSLSGCGLGGNGFVWQVVVVQAAVVLAGF